MQIVIWVGIVAGVFAAVWFAAPYHCNMIDSRDLDIETKKPWD
jgi:hypothetical protein